MTTTVEPKRHRMHPILPSRFSFSFSQRDDITALSSKYIFLIIPSNDKSSVQVYFVHRRQAAVPHGKGGYLGDWNPSLQWYCLTPNYFGPPCWNRMPFLSPKPTASKHWRMITTTFIITIKYATLWQTSCNYPSSGRSCTLLGAAVASLLEL